MPAEPSVTSASPGPWLCTLRYLSALLPNSFERPGPKSVSPATNCSGVAVVVWLRWIVTMCAPSSAVTLRIARRPRQQGWLPFWGGAPDHVRRGGPGPRPGAGARAGLPRRGREDLPRASHLLHHQGVRLLRGIDEGRRYLSAARAFGARSARSRRARGPARGRALLRARLPGCLRVDRGGPDRGHRLG